MFVILLMTIIVGGLVVTSSVQLGKAQNSYVNFSGTISSDTTWSVGNTYNLTGSTIVAKGATLTIEPGVSVIFSNFVYSNGTEYRGNIQIEGTIIAKGTRTNRILFYGNSPIAGRNTFGAIKFESSVGWNEKTDKGSIVEYTQGEAITIINSSPKINQNILNGMYVESSNFGQ